MSRRQPRLGLSRRDFIRIAGLTVAATAVTCSGLGYVATRAPAVETPELTFGEEATMSRRVLITYATRAGSTAEIAAAIGETLSTRGYTVDVKPVKQKPNLAGYVAVVIGSAVRMGNWLPEAVDFVKANQTALAQLPVALFTVYMLHTGDDEASRTARLAYLNAVRPLLKGAEEVYFEGKMDFSRLSLLDRLIARMVGAVEADRRDWNRIRNWIPSALA